MQDDHAKNKADGAPSLQPPPPSDTLAAFLSYLVPGLGQVYQGRVGKGVLFLVCVYLLFFYGMYLGSGSVTVKGETYTVPSNVYLPDTADQSNPLGLPRLAANLYNRPQFLGQFWVGIAAWPALWQYYTYDGRKKDDGPTLLGDFERTPTAEALNALNTSGDKTIDLGWVYTVIAGVLNIMVIYDALAGPAFRPSADKKSREPDGPRAEEAAA
jgi:hypothetical protein